MTYLYELGMAPVDFELMGGKGANLARMHKLGLPVPAAMIIPTSLCRDYMCDPIEVMKNIRKDTIPKLVAYFTDTCGYLPLVSVRSGAKFSMPGMMDTILNVGLHPGNFQKWQDRIGAECAEDCWVRLQKMYLDVVKTKAPDTIEEQLAGAIESVFKSWNNERAKTYRKLHDIPETLGTAVIIQQMVFGNLNDKSCTGVLFTRDPSTGEDEITGEFLVGAQGEDVVAGTKTPSPLHLLKKWNPSIAKKLATMVSDLEDEYGDMLDVEFTVEDGKLYILQCRVGKRTAKAAIHIAMSFHKAGKLTPEQTLKRVTYSQYLLATKPIIDPTFDIAPHAVGIPASVGVATGVAVFTAEEAVESKEPCILISADTTPDDIAGMNAAKGILTSTGGATSHAAVVARGMNKVCVVGCSALVKHGSTWIVESGDVRVTIKRGTKVTIEGSTGRVWVNRDVPIVDGSQDPTITEFQRLVYQVREFFEIIVDPTQVKPKRSWFPLYAIENQNISKIVGSLNFMIKKMESGVLDFRFSWQLCDPPDLLTYQMLDIPHTTSILFESIVPSMPVLDGSKDIWVVLPPKYTYSANLIQILTDRGYKIMPFVSNVNDLLLNSSMGLMDFDPAKFGSGAASMLKLFERVRELKSKAGETESAILIYSGDWPTPTMSDMVAMTRTAALKLSLAS